MNSTNFFERHKVLTFVMAGLIGGAVSLGGFAIIQGNNRSIEARQANSAQLARYASLNTQPAFDFTGVADIANPAVVHIKSTFGAVSKSRQADPEQPFDPFEFFRNGPGGGGGFQVPQGPQMASGSGVIISDDGYIATNNHVVENATQIEVVLNDKRSYIADVVGMDKNTDIALLRIAEKDLPFLKFGNSEEVKVGQWVVAVGNPFNLNSTVTVGIVSAVGRNIDLIRSKGNKYAIENFIQTDAAINPGNSGGALVNTAGELVGINTAIASETGSYAGYAFAVPVNLVKKVVNDLMKFGKVQRALLGVSIQEVTSELKEEKELPDLKGVFVAEVIEGGAAIKGGIKKGDVILKIDGVEVNSSSKLQEQIGRNQPGDKVKVTLRRAGAIKELEVVLLSETGGLKTETTTTADVGKINGISLENTSAEERKKLGIKNGVRVKSVDEGAFRNAGIPEDFVITHIDNEPVYSVQGGVNLLKNLRGAITIEGRTANGDEKVFAVKLPS